MTGTDTVNSEMFSCDAARRRTLLYQEGHLPADEMARFNVTEEGLFAKRFTPGYAELLAFQVARTREMFARGRKLPEIVGGRLRYELRLTWHGGVRILEQIAQNGYNTLTERPRIMTGDKFALLARTLFNLS